MCWKKTKAAKYQKAELVLMEWFWQKQALNLPVVLVKNTLSGVQECVQISKEGKT
jgi:hypothetical protein